MLPWEVTRPADLRREPGVDFAVDVAAQRASKAAALRAHRTQNVPIDRCFFSKRDVDGILGLELFRQAWGPPLRRVARGRRARGHRSHGVKSMHYAYLMIAIRTCNCTEPPRRKRRADGRAGL